MRLAPAIVLSFLLSSCINMIPPLLMIGERIIDRDYYEQNERYKELEESATGDGSQIDTLNANTWQRRRQTGKEISK